MTENERKHMGELRKLQKDMDRLLESSRARLGGATMEEDLWQPAADIYEDEEKILLKVELPEIREEDIRIRLDAHLLTVEGERPLEEGRRQNYLRLERSYGPFSRSFALPDEVDPERLQVNAEMGVLRVVLPKKNVRSEE